MTDGPHSGIALSAASSSKPRRARPFFARHPWVFDSSIDRVEGEPAPATRSTSSPTRASSSPAGLYNPASTIRVRLYRWDEARSTKPSGPA